MVNTILVPVAVAIVSVLVGGCAGYSIRKNKWETQAQNAAHDAKHILADAESKAKAVEADLASQKEAMMLLIIKIVCWIKKIHNSHRKKTKLKNCRLKF